MRWGRGCERRVGSGGGRAVEWFTRGCGGDGREVPKVTLALLA